MIIIFTGNGKGKTTAALGQAVRAIGQGKRVLMIQFIKGPFISGEHKFLKKFRITSSRFQIIRAGKGFVKIASDKLPFSIHKKAAQRALVLAQKAIRSKKYDLIILDEINVAVSLGLINVTEVLRLLKEVRVSLRDSAPDLILTGRSAPKSFIKLADIVTEIKEIKYPKGIGGYVPKKGIEF